MLRKRPLLEKREIPLLCQEKILGLDAVPRKKGWTRYKRALRIFSLTLFITLMLTLTVFLVGALKAGVLDDIRAVIVSGVFEHFFGIDTDTESDSETHEPESETDTETDTDTETSTDTPAPDTDPPETKPVVNEPESEPLTPELLYYFDPSTVPEGELAVIPMDLSLYTSGTTYINNSTGYAINAETLLERELGGDIGFEKLSSVDEPTVLIIHTHGTEAYLEDGAISYSDDGGELARSTDKGESVVAVGELMARILNENGVSAVHCTFMHDSVGYRNSYARAEETIKEYLEAYPTIKLVIDIHRDGVMRSTGELVRPVTVVEGEAVAQVMCVVGSDYGGEACPAWQDNLSLALKLRHKLNGEYMNVCRPTDLRASTYNQEFSRYSLLLEIGSCANSLEEALRAAELVARTLVEIIKEI